VVEDGRVQEAEDGVDAAVVEEAEATDLIALEHVVECIDLARRRHPEHADLLVEVAQVRDLHDLLLVLEARVAVRAEEALARIQDVTPGAVEAEILNDRDAVGAAAATEEITPCLLVGGEGVVERP